MVYELLSVLWITMWLLAFWFRFQPSGVACSGKLSEKFEDASLKYQGLFIFVPAVVFGVQFSIYAIRQVNAAYKDRFKKQDGRRKSLEMQQREDWFTYKFKFNSRS